MFLIVVGAANVASAQALTEGFDSVANLPTLGWVQVNRSPPLGSSVWSQCGGTAIPPAHSGASTSCALVNFNSTTGVGTISNWLITPVVTLTNGATVSFYTKTPSNAFPDRLQLRMSTSGTSTDTGTTATSVGVFTTLLVDIDPTYAGTYPTTWTQFTATISGLPGPTQGRFAFRYFVENGGPDGDNSNIIGLDTFAYTPGTTATDAVLDYNGDNKTDYVVTRNAGNQMTWYINTGTTQTITPWGINSDFAIGGDFDGDNKDDIAVYRPAAAPNSYFYILQSANNTLVARELGATGDDPTVVGDYDGDNKDDMAVYREGAAAGAQSFWYYRPSTAPTTIVYVPYGTIGDTAIPGDFDGDGKNDFTIQRSAGNGQGLFVTAKSGSSFATELVLWGTPTDQVAPGDYDGDGKTDFAVVRSSGGQYLWSILGRNNNNVIQYALPWGSSTDIVTQGDYDGDGKTDISVWRPNANGEQNFFYTRQSSNGNLLSFEWGQNGDYPVANFNVH
jgi:hypothetical protein